MRRKLSVILLTGAIMVSAVACSSDNKSEDAIKDQTTVTEEAIDENSSNQTGEEVAEHNAPSQDNTSQQDTVDENMNEIWSEQTGANYHTAIKKVGDEIFYLSENGIYSVNLKSQVTTTIYSVPKDKSISSYSLYQGNIYYIETWNEGFEPISSLSRITVDGKDNQTLLTFNLPNVKISVYEDILYMSAWGEHACYRIQEDGSLSEKLEDSQTYYSMIKNLNTETVSNQLMTVGDSLNRYDSIWTVDSYGTLWNFNLADGTSTEYKIQDQTPIAVVKPYIVTMSYEEDSYQFYLLNMDTMESKTWLKGNEYYLDSDEFGCYFGISSEDGQKHSYEYITWDGAKTTLFEVETIPGMEAETSTGVRNFSVIDGVIYYQYGDVDKMYLMSRDVDQITQENKLGSSYLDKHYSNYGHVENETHNEMFIEDASKTLIRISYDQLIFDGDSEAVQKINKEFLEIKEANIKAEIERARQDEEFLKEMEGTDGYSYTSYISGITFFNERYVCVEQSEYTYTGGAHGMPIRNYYVLDLETGKRLLLEDIVSESEDEIHAIAAKYFQEIYEATPELFFEEAVDTVQNTAGYNNMFYLSEDGIVFYYPPYELASYAAGFQKIVVPYSEFHLKIDVSK